MLKANKSIALFLVIAVLLTTVATLVACTPAKPTQQFKLRVGVIATTDVLPHYVILDQGFDKKNSLELIVESYQGGAALIKALAEGSVDCAASVGTVPLILDAVNGIVPSKVLSVAACSFADIEHPGTAMLVASSIKSWKDLEGQLIGVNSKTSVTAGGAIGRLNLEGINKYTLVEMSFANMGLAIVGGNIAAAALVEPYLTQSILRKDGKILDWVIGGKPFEKMQYTMSVFNADVYKNSPEKVKAYLRAHIAAVSWIKQNINQARSILGRALNLNQEVAQNMQLLNWPTDVHNDPALLESMQTVLVSMGWLKNPIPAKQLYDETLLNEVLAEKR